MTVLFGDMKARPWAFESAPSGRFDGGLFPTSTAFQSDKCRMRQTSRRRTERSSKCERFSRRQSFGVIARLAAMATFASVVVRGMGTHAGGCPFRTTRLVR